MCHSGGDRRWPREQGWAQERETLVLGAGSFYLMEGSGREKDKYWETWGGRYLRGDAQNRWQQG